MFCPNCGKEHEDNVNFCSNCGYKFAKEGNNDEQRGPVVNLSKLYTTEDPTIEMQATPKALIEAARERAKAAGNQGPLVYNESKFKAKCEYCYTVFTYYQSNLGYRAWYPHGFVYCPNCKKPLRHSNDLLINRYTITLGDNGEVIDTVVQ